MKVTCLRDNISFSSFWFREIFYSIFSANVKYKLKIMLLFYFSSIRA